MTELETFFHKKVGPLITELRVSPSIGRKYKFRAVLNTDKNQCEIYVTLVGLERVGGGPPVDLGGEPIILSNPAMTEDRILQLILTMVVGRVGHELAENFYVGDQRPFDPHKRRITHTLTFHRD